MPGKATPLRRRVQVIGEGQDHCVDTSHDVAIVPKRDRAEAIATPKVLQARGVQITDGGQLHLGRTARPEDGRLWQWRRSR